MIIKLIAFGVDSYFDDNWYIYLSLSHFFTKNIRNKFDFTLILFSILFDFILLKVISQTLISSIKANRIIKLAKI